VKEFILKTETWVPQPRKVVFPFFANAGNLQRLTPPWLHFEIISDDLDTRQGLLLDYRIRLHGIPVRWRTRIDVWEPPFRFVDVQLHGPYRQWIHEHTFREQAGGTMCCDVVRYSVPGGRWIERIVHSAMVKSQIDRIFAFRQLEIRKIFAAEASSHADEVNSNGRLQKVDFANAD
jgi:ligand-binding SRPBCC domain-containing protein